MHPPVSESLYFSLQAHDIMVNQNNGFERVVFASDVTPGAAHEDGQNLVWLVEHDAPDGC